MKLNIEKVNIKDLISPEFNPRVISKEELEKLKKSITEFGYIEPIIVNKQNNHIISGNQRARALTEIGESKIDVIYVDIEDLEQEKMASIALNKISGDWDETKLEEIFKELKVEGLDLDLTGFTDVELEDFIDDNLEFDLAIEEEEPVKEVVFVPTENEELIDEEKIEEAKESIVEEEPVKEEPIKKEEVKLDKPKKEEPKKELIKKEINIKEEYKPNISDIKKDNHKKQSRKTVVEKPTEKPVVEDIAIEKRDESKKHNKTIPTPLYLPIAPVKRIIKESGAERVSDEAGKILALVLEENAKQISEKAVMMANVAGRKTLYAEDFEIILNS